MDVIITTHGWYNITVATLKHNGATSLLNVHKSLGKLLTTLYPEYKEACRRSVMKMVHTLKLHAVEELLSVPYEELQALEPQLLRQHDQSIVKCKKRSQISTLQYFLFSQSYALAEQKVLECGNLTSALLSLTRKFTCDQYSPLVFLN